MEVIETGLISDWELLMSRLDSAMPYEKYLELVSDLAGSGQTTGPAQTESLVAYTLLNNKRLKRWEKTLRIPAEVAAVVKSDNRRLSWIVITESWCGDAAPTMPVMNKLVGLNNNYELLVLLRDENPELMERFHTNGAHSIPKLILADEDNNEIIGTWGPRPSTATAMAEKYKAEYGSLSAEFKEDLQLWYNRDKGRDTLRGLLELLALENIGDRSDL